MFKKLTAALLLAAAGLASAAADNTGISGTHAIGNGRVCVYAKDADIPSVFGPVYSAPPLLSRKA